MNLYNDYLKSLATLISYKSVKSTPENNAPFGTGCKDALEYFLSLAKSFGFEVINYDNYAGEVIFGEGEEFGIIGHLDVVPEGDGWNTPPYELTLIDDVYYARGLDDDKGPLLACLYALKSLKDKGIKPNKRFRLFAGCDEESGWNDIEYLNKKTVLPINGFSPDGNFPVTYAEKGVIRFNFYLPSFKNFSNVKGGTVINAVCAYVSAKASSEGINETLINKHGLSLKNGNVLESFGKSAHGSTPQFGKNAMLAFLNYLRDCGEDVGKVIECLFDDKFNFSKISNEQGALTISPDLIYEEDGKVVIACDCRVPAPIQPEEIVEFVKKFGIEFTYKISHPPFMIDKNGYVIQTLLKSYRDITGDLTPPKAMGGSTFGRAFSGGCSFGPALPGSNHHIHEPNECVKASELKTTFDIYLKTLENLSK